MGILITIIVIVASMSIINRSEYNGLGSIKSNLIWLCIGLGIMLGAFVIG